MKSAHAYRENMHTLPSIEPIQGPATPPSRTRIGSYRLALAGILAAIAALTVLLAPDFRLRWVLAVAVGSSAASAILASLASRSHTRSQQHRGY